MEDQINHYDSIERADIERSFGDILKVNDHEIKAKIKDTRVELKRTTNLTNTILGS